MPPKQLILCPALSLSWGILVILLEFFAAPISADGVLWITKDAAGKTFVANIPMDHPALKATGAESAKWKKTEFFLAQERSAARRLEDKILDQEVEKYAAKKVSLLRRVCA
jgi:hypothetical protein